MQMSVTAQYVAQQVPRWRAAKLSTDHVGEASKIVARIMANKARYAIVDVLTGVPWYVIAGLHNMESGGSFNCHLHEGSPLTGRTKYEPKGRPKTGSPPFTWENSAVDALQYDKMGEVKWAYLGETLYACERYNGTGYLAYHPDVPTPYLWAGTTIEQPGKYVSDGRWSSSAKSEQLGIAAIWKKMESDGILDFSKLK